MSDARLILENGMVFHGKSFGNYGDVVGEVVFNTGMTGYQEILTDPSYCGQIVTMTYPLIGNYGINIDDIESSRPQIKGFIIRELSKSPSNWRSIETLHNYLEKHNIIGIEGIDTRELTRTLREEGTIRGIISTNYKEITSKLLNQIKSYRIINPVDIVSTKKIIHYEGTGFRVAVLDFGVKQNIIRSLLNRNCDVYVFPSRSSSQEILSYKPHGLLLSNGPGDPKDCNTEIDTVKELLGVLPIFGVCLGHQLIALASGANTEKLRYGHRGCNHPVKNLATDKTYITSQNHGYTIVEDSLDKSIIEVSHISMNDFSIEGIRYKNIPVTSVQFHPEASPGPTDTAYLFDDFMTQLFVASEKTK